MQESSVIEEQIESETIAWSQTNEYWIDNNNFVLKSTQYVSPSYLNTLPSSKKTIIKILFYFQLKGHETLIKMK